MMKYFSKQIQQEISRYLAGFSVREKLAYFEEAERSIALRMQNGISPAAYTGLIRRIGEYLFSTVGPKFTADYQKIRITDTVTLYSVQLPGGGNLNVFVAPEGKFVVDTGYAVYYADCETMMKSLGIGDFSDVREVICTHGDADHCGASGYFPVLPVMHPVTRDLLNSGSRGFAANTPLEPLEKFYTTTINTISRMKIPDRVRVTGTKIRKMRGLFPVIDSVSFAGMNFEVWESLGGHIAGQLLLYEPELGLLFTSDAYINFATLTKDRADYCSIADSMIGSVNVNSEIARTERNELMRLFEELDTDLRLRGKRLTVCCGHGAVCCLENGRLVPVSELLHYEAGVTP